MNSLILGGIKSGKTRLAERLASESGKAVVVIATASVEYTANDPEMAARIEKHKAVRPQHWRVIEEPIAISEVIRGCTSEEIVIVDCLTLWLTNLLTQNDDDLLNDQRAKLLNTLKLNSTDVILVSNETSMGIIPLGELTRRFCDEAGTLHQQLADVADRVTLCIAGLPHLLKDNLSAKATPGKPI